MPPTFFSRTLTNGAPTREPSKPRASEVSGEVYPKAAAIPDVTQPVTDNEVPAALHLACLVLCFSTSVERMVLRDRNALPAASAGSETPTFCLAESIRRAKVCLSLLAYAVFAESRHLLQWEGGEDRRWQRPLVHDCVPQAIWLGSHLSNLGRICHLVLEQNGRI